MYFLYYGSYGLAILSFIISIAVQINMNSTFSKYSKINSKSYITGADAAQKILMSKGLYDVRVERVSGNLTDHYDPRANVVRLSDSTYNSTSIAAIGVAAHECGHAIQHAEGYAPVKLRTGIANFTKASSMLSYVLILMGVFFDSFNLITIGIAFFSVVAFFQLVTLPVEFDASKRALKILAGSGMVNYEEENGVKKVLGAAALTYVAALVTSVLYIIRLLGRFRD